MPPMFWEPNRRPKTGFEVRVNFINTLNLFLLKHIRNLFQSLAPMNRDMKADKSIEF